MFNEAFIAKVLAQAKGAAIAKSKELLVGELRARFDNDLRFQSAVAADREQILWTLHAAAIAVGRALTGQPLDGEQAVQALCALATDPDTVRRFRALLNEAATSTDERIAMLAVGYFVGGQEPSLRERLDWALRGLFPADAEALATIVTFEDQRRMAEHPLLVEERGDPGPYGCVLMPAIDGTPSRYDVLPTPIAPESVRALERAQCLSLVDWAQRRPRTYEEGAIDRVVEVLPLGRELHRILSTVDWKEFAHRRGPGLGAVP